MLPVKSEPEISAKRRVLLVDDSRLQRRILKLMLTKWGYEVVEAASAAEGLQICAVQPIDIVISDWMMPNMTGIDFCEHFRALGRDSYGYFILLTSKSEAREIARGLDVGADDFLTKPVDSGELRARLRAGERILQMEAALSQKTKQVASALSELQIVYDSIDRDLQQARKIQESLVPDSVLHFGKSTVSMLLKPCGHVGGDLVGAFSPGPNRIGFYNIDVSGHGVTSAMMTARLSGYLSGRHVEQNIALEQRFEKFYALRSPESVANILNERLLSDQGVEEYFTMIYGTADLTNGIVRLVQAGHPPMFLQRADGSVEILGDGGMPIGLLPEPEFDCIELRLNPGDRVFLCSDGFTESVDREGVMLDDDGMAAMIEAAHDMRGKDCLDGLFWSLTERRPNAPLEDDVSAIVLEYNGA